MKKIIVYDCDGVIFDSTNAVCAYYDHVFEKFGLQKLDWKDSGVLRTAMMGTNEQIINQFVKEQKVIDEIMEFATKVNFKEFTPLMVPFDGMKETLEKLKSENYELAVFTNRGISLTYLLEYFGFIDYFSYRVTCFDVKKPKPDPEGLYKIMKNYNAKKEELIFIGDSPTDYHAAKAADVDFLAFQHELGDSRIINHHLELFDYL